MKDGIAKIGSREGEEEEILNKMGKKRKSITWQCEMGQGEGRGGGGGLPRKANE